MDSSGVTFSVEREFGEFVIDAHTPETIPMARLAEYMTKLSDLLGKDEAVHFEKVESGSLKIKYWTPKSDTSRVMQGPAKLLAGEPDKAAMSAYRQLNDLLESDRAVGTMTFSGLVLPFPGRERTHSPAYGPLDEEMVVEGQLVRIGGKDKSIHAQIRDGDTYYNCQMSRGLAMDMCRYLFGPTIRIAGRARWQRNRDGEWQLLDFFANKFEELDDSALSVVVAQLRKIDGNGWLDIQAPLAELHRLRYEG